jgi:hypothetical protein
MDIMLASIWTVSTRTTGLNSPAVARIYLYLDKKSISNFESMVLVECQMTQISLNPTSSKKRTIYNKPSQIIPSTEEE